MVNEGGEKEKMELFVNFCEDTIFEMQLAAQMSDAGERSSVKEESELEKPDEENPEMGFFSVTTVRMALLALRYNVMLLIKVGAQRALTAARCQKGHTCILKYLQRLCEHFCKSTYLLLL